MNCRIISLLVMITVLFWMVPVEASSPNADGEYYYRGKVLSVTETIDDFDTIQEVEVELTSGPMKGEIVTVQNYYYPGDPLFNIDAKEGKSVIVVAIGAEGSLENIYLQDLARDQGIYYLLAVLIALLVLVGRGKGIKTILTLLITGVLIFKVLLPLLLKGYSPILISVIVACIVIVITLFIIGGFNSKSLSAIIGTTVGVMIAGLMALWVGSISSLTGFSSAEANMLYYMDYSLDIRGLLFAGIIIGSLGAITDVGMSVASAAAEIKEAKPKINVRELTLGALNVGRDVMGTMANTLILAYVGATTPLLLMVMGYEIDWVKIINMDTIATEFVRGIAGTIGLVVAVPITAFVSGLLLVRRK